MSTLFSRVASHSITHVLFAFIMMGGWALFANRQHPMPEPLIAALVQGALSATITLVMKKYLDYLSANVSGFKALWLPPLIVCACSLTVLVLVHKLAGTPELFQTIALPFSVAATYAVAYSLMLYRKKESHV